MALKVFSHADIKKFLGPTPAATDEETAEKLVAISDACFEFLVVILENCWDNDDRDQAFAAARLARTYANASILAGPQLPETVAERPLNPNA